MSDTSAPTSAIPDSELSVSTNPGWARVEIQLPIDSDLEERVAAGTKEDRFIVLGARAMRRRTIMYVLGAGLAFGGMGLACGGVGGAAGGVVVGYVLGE
jgi:hypothetical protein